MKRIIGILLSVATVLTVLFVSGCESADMEGKAYIGIISAMDNEIEILLNEAEIERVDTIGGEEFHVGTLRGQSVVISKSGIGKVRASSGATAMLNNYNISCVIFTGIAGGVADDVQVLDEVVATSIIEHDYGIITNDGFVWKSGDPGYGTGEGEYYYCDEKLSALAYQASVEVVGEEHTFQGVIATGDQFVASETYVAKLQSEYNAYACEMEGAAVAVVCIKYGTPFVVIRALSDKADGNAHESYDNFGDIAADNSSRIVLKMLESL